MKLRASMCAVGGMVALATACGGSASGGARLTTADTPSSTPATSPTSPRVGTPAITSAAVADTLANLRELATAEELYFTDAGRYTANSTVLEGGFTSGPGLATETLLAGVDAKKGYCLIGGVSAVDGPWFTYDSQVRGGFLRNTFADQSSAKEACSDSGITRYRVLALA